MPNSPRDNSAQLASPAYRLAALDQDFLLGPTMRGARLLIEYEKAEQALQAYGVESTLVVFGSARVREDGPERLARWYAEARAFASIASKEGGAVDGDGKRRRNVIATGGGPGVMEAANRGAFEAGAPSIGFNITLLTEQQPNRFTTPALTFQFRYFAMRKLHFAMRARALIVFPGGFGTLDELFELITLVQTRKSVRVPIVLVDEAYWREIINFTALLDYGVVSREDFALLSFADDGAGAWRTLLAAGLPIS